MRSVTRAEDWFADQGWEVLAFQRRVWAATGNGESGLIHALTGTGKTHAAWLVPSGRIWLAGDDGSWRLHSTDMTRWHDCDALTARSISR